MSVGLGEWGGHITNSVSPLSGCGGKWGSAVSVGSVSVWDVLELRLSRHSGLVSSTVATAVKESQINSHIKEISNVRKGTTYHSYIYEIICIIVVSAVIKRKNVGS